MFARVYNNRRDPIVCCGGVITLLYYRIRLSDVSARRSGGIGDGAYIVMVIFGQ